MCVMFFKNKKKKERKIDLKNDRERILQTHFLFLSHSPYLLTHAHVHYDLVQFSAIFNSIIQNVQPSNLMTKKNQSLKIAPTVN